VLLVTRLEKLHMRVASAPANARFEDVVHLAEAAGFVRDRIRGSHHNFIHTDDPSTVLTLQAEDGQAKLYQVRQLLDMIDRLHLRRW
jgi:predicted RNA binding protein YcfA (HicA-like mRNA interferase family)